MAASDYGPIPVGRLNVEKGRMYDALGEGRRVQISRHGRVCTVIEPHNRLTVDVLAAYAVAGDDLPLRELIPATISSGNPSELITDAENGIPSYVT